MIAQAIKSFDGITGRVRSVPHARITDKFLDDARGEPGAAIDAERFRERAPLVPQRHDQGVLLGKRSFACRSRRRVLDGCAHLGEAERHPARQDIGAPPQSQRSFDLTPNGRDRACSLRFSRHAGKG